MISNFSIIMLVFLLMVSAFFSASETAVTAASRARVFALAKSKKSASASLANKLLENKDRLLTIMLFCNNVVNIFASAYFTSVMIAIYGDSGVAIATAVVTVVIVLFGEVIPKNIALYGADRIILAIAYPLYGFSILMRPLTYVIENINRWTIKWLRLDQLKSDDEKDEELRGVIHMQEEKDMVEREEKLMLQSVLDLADNALDSAMTPKSSVYMIANDWDLKKMLNAIVKSPYSHIPVYDANDGTVIGVFHVKSLLRQNVWRVDLTKAELLNFAAKPWFVPISTSLAQQLQQFRSHGKHFALVVDEYGDFKGVVTLEDILSEIVGKIEDTEKAKNKDYEIASDGSIIVNGSVTVRNLNRQLGWELPEEGINTLAGLLLREAKILPEVGTGITAHGFHFVVLSVYRQQLTKVKIKKLRKITANNKLAAKTAAVKLPMNFRKIMNGKNSANKILNKNIIKTIDKAMVDKNSDGKNGKIKQQ